MERASNDSKKKKNKNFNAFKNVTNEYLVVDGLEQKYEKVDLYETRPFNSEAAVQLRAKIDIKNGIIDGEISGISSEQKDLRNQK